MFRNLSNRVKLMMLATFLIALIVIPMTIIQVQKQQEIRQHAASPDSVSFNLNPQSAKEKVGESFNTDVHLLNSFGKDISSVDVIIQYDSSILGASFQPNGAIGYTTILNESKDNTIHYVAVNSSRTPIIGTDLTLGTLTLTGKVDGKGKVSLENIQVTASGNSSSLVIDTSSIGTTERQYIIGDIEPSSTIASPTPAPSSAPTYACVPAGGQCTSVSTACSSLGSYVWGGYGSDYCPYNFRPQCCLPVVAPAPDQSQTYNQCLKICEQGSLLAPETFNKPACIQECDSKYKQPESATVPIGSKPDLSITDVKFRKKPTTTLAEIIVKNIGDADAIRNVNDIEVSIGDTNSSFGSLKAGESTTIEIIDMTGKMIDGQQITSIVDVTNVIDEINEINNKFTTTVKFEKVCQTSTQFDLNKDDKVDENDANICKAYLGKEVNEKSAKCDFNGDCKVDSEDLDMHASKVKTRVTLDTDTIGLAGEEIKVAVTAKNDYYGIDNIGLFYGYDGDVSYTSYGCGGQKSCTKELSIDVQKSGKFYLAANTFNSVPGNNLISYYPMEDYISLKEGQTVKFDGKEIELISISKNQQNVMENLKIRIGNSFEDVKFGRSKFVEGILMRSIFAQGKSFDELETTFMVIKPKTVDVMDLKSAVIPEKGSPGTMFTITAKLETPEKFSVLARIQSPSAKETTLQFYDDGAHGDYNPNDEFYANTISAYEIGTYFVTIVAENEKGKIEAKNAANFSVSDLQSNCMPITKNGDASNLIDVVFALNNYAGSDKSEVSKVISRHADFLFSKEPFKSNKGKFNLYYLGEFHETDCGFAIGDICISFFQKAVSSICPFFDEIIVLDRNGLSSTVIVDGVQKAMSAGGYSRPRTAVVGTASAAGTEGVSVHEFGHSFGWLADEYDAPWVGFSNTKAANCDTFACPKWCSGKSDLIEPMCYKLSTEQECKGKSYNGVNCAWSAFDGGKTTKCDFPYSSDIDFGTACRDDTKCLYGCGGSAGYRSSKYSIMGDTNNGKVNDYNTISKQQIQKIIDNWGKGK